MPDEETQQAIRLDQSYRQLYRQAWIAFIVIWVVLIILLIWNVSAALVIAVGITQTVVFLLANRLLAREHHRRLINFIDENGQLTFHEEHVPLFAAPILTRRQMWGTGATLILVILALILR